MEKQLDGIVWWDFSNSIEPVKKKIPEFPEFPKQKVRNFLMFQENFGFLDGTLISLRSLLLALPPFPPLAGQVGTG
jgi:hypothetical protein